MTLQLPSDCSDLELGTLTPCCLIPLVAWRLSVLSGYKQGTLGLACATCHAGGKQPPLGPGGGTATSFSCTCWSPGRWMDAVGHSRSLDVWNLTAQFRECSEGGWLSRTAVRVPVPPLGSSGMKPLSLLCCRPLPPQTLIHSWTLSAEGDPCLLQQGSFAGRPWAGGGVLLLRWVVGRGDVWVAHPLQWMVTCSVLGMEL